MSDSSHDRLRTMRLLPAIAGVLLIAASCGEKERSYVSSLVDGDVSPTMTTYEVETFISDSGYTRYHISTPLWKMFDEASEPFWRFPEGLELQQYDLDMNPDATMDCDSAIYYSRKRLWRLDGHVIMVNTQRDSFLSQQLFWDQTKRRVYTDSFIHIVRSDRIIEGYGFESNENMTAYTVNKPTAILPVPKRLSEDSAETDSTAVDTLDTTVRRQAQRGSMRKSSDDRTLEHKPIRVDSKTERVRLTPVDK